MHCQEPEYSKISIEEPVLQKSVYNTALRLHISTLFGDKETSDLQLGVTADQTYYVHKLILAQSPVFESMLYGKGWQESDASVVKLSEEAKYVPHCKTFLSFLYGLQIQITWKNVEALIYFGDKYVVESLLNTCMEFLKKEAEKNGDLVGAINAWKMTKRVLLHQRDSLTALEDVLFSNIELCMKDDSIVKTLDITDLKHILESNNLVCRTELTIYRLTEAWLISKDIGDRLRALKELSPLFKTPYMRVTELSYVENSYKRLFPNASSVEHKSCKDLLRLTLFDAYKFHVSCDNDKEKYVDLPPSRLYTDVGACMKYRLKNLNGLSSWTKMKDFFEVKEILQKEGSTFAVTLMRKINASLDKHRKSLLSLEIRQLSPIPLGFTQASIFVHENRKGHIFRKLLNRVQLPSSSPVLTEIHLEGVSYDDVLKKSVYQFDNSPSYPVFLAIDIFLH